MFRIEGLIKQATEDLADCMTDAKVKVSQELDQVSEVVSSIQSEMKDTDAALEEDVKQLMAFDSKDQAVAETCSSLQDKLKTLGINVESSQTALGAILTQIREEFNTEFGNVMDMIHKQRKEMDDAILLQNNHMTRVASFREKAFQDMNSCLMKAFEDQRKELESCQKEVETLRKMQEVMDNERDIELSLLQKSILEMRTKNKTRKGQTQAKVEDMITRHEVMVKASEEKEVRLKSSLETLSSNLGNGEKLGFEFLNEMDQIVAKNIQTNSNRMTAMGDKHWKGQSQAIESVFKIETMSELKESEFLAEQLEDMVKKVMEERKSQVVAIEENRAQSTRKLEEYVNQALTKSAETKQTACEEVRNFQLMSESNQRCFLRELKTQVVDLETLLKKVKVCPTTGITPQKTEYSYPRKLVTTSRDVGLRVRVDEPSIAMSDADLLGVSDSDLLSSDSDNMSGESVDENQSPA
jgi:hypothetical protein